MSDPGAPSGRRFEILPSASPATAQDLVWMSQAASVESEGLVSIQRTAERWGATVLVITGLLATLAAFQTPGQISAVTSRGDWRAAAGVLVAGSLLSALVAVVAAARSAQGRVIRLVPTPAELRKATQSEAQRAAKNLARSRFAALLILPLYVAGLAVTVYAPRLGEDAVRVTVRSGESYCASQVVIAGSKARLTVKSLGTRDVDWSEVVSISLAADCS